MLYERLLKPALFRLDPERAHDLVTSLLEKAGPFLPRRGVAGLEKEVLGLKFPNPLGLAAGFDKDGRLACVLPSLGFGFVEIGSVTLRPQPGNPRPRMFRFPEHKAVVNRLGFNSEGADAVALRLSRMKKTVPLGINLGLNKDAPASDAPRQYAETFKKLAPYGDYFVVNVSSPNTPGLRDLQQRLHLEKILESIQEVNAKRSPVLVKLAPDLADEQLPDLVGLGGRLAAGFVVSNTTISRPVDVGETQGGLSGAPLRALSTAMIRKVRALTKLPIIGVGGIFTGADAMEKLFAGADLVQLYTSMIYRGPGTPLRVLRELRDLLK